MIFNSLDFLIFAAIFFPLYFLLKGKARLWLCLIASYFFYGYWDWRFLSLIVFSTCLDYFLGLAIARNEDEKIRKRYLIISMMVNLGFLGFFKYFNFFIDSFRGMMYDIGLHLNYDTLDIILPVGISFYTFQSMSYTIDVYKRQIPIEQNFLRFATFISFFPQLVAGPIVRASEFLPQFQKDREFDHDRFVAGLGQVLWGFFKKVAVADSLAPYVDQCFMAPEGFSSMHLLIGIIFYSFQIYCDFSGYSDIAIGLARILGFDFPRNFRTPYFSRDFSEFWRRWHISLSSWLRDYLYIPLGGNRSGSFGSWFFIALFALISVLATGWWWLFGIYAAIGLASFFFMKSSQENSRLGYNYMNLMVTMLLGGLWHGASYAFIFWGFLHGAYLVVQRLIGPYWTGLLKLIRTPAFIRGGIAIAMVYFFTCLAWVYFRAPSFDIANTYISRIASLEGFSFGTVIHKFQVVKGMFLIGALVGVEFVDLYAPMYKRSLQSPAFRVLSFAALLWLIAFFGTFGSNAFIYFQF